MLVQRVARGRSVPDQRSFMLAVGGVSFLLGSLALATIVGGFRGHVELLVVLSALAVASESQAMQFSGRVWLSMTGPIVVLAAVLLGPIGGVLVAVASMLGDWRGPVPRWVTYTGLFAAQGVAAGFAADATRSLAAKIVMASAAWAVVNITGFLIIAFVRRMDSIGGNVRIVATVVGGGSLFAAPVVLLLGSIYTRDGITPLLFSAVPLLACHQLFGMYKKNQGLAVALSEGNMTFALSLVRALDARDAHTAGHSASVAVYARDVAIAKGLPASEVANIQLAALLHDIGKIGVPTEVLLKNGALDDDEWMAIRAHPQIGADIAGETPVFVEIARFIRHHHERPDGRGYPDGLVGDRIPLASAIIGVADSYNAMTSCRPYRDAMTPDEAIVELRRGAGTQFDAQVVDLFIGVLQAHDGEYRLGLGDRFSLDGQRVQMLAELGARREVVGAAA